MLQYLSRAVFSEQRFHFAAALCFRRLRHIWVEQAAIRVVTLAFSPRSLRPCSSFFTGQPRLSIFKGHLRVLYKSALPVYFSKALRV